jgi:NitT/TauT family transport system substrate-binding protein
MKLNKIVGYSILIVLFSLMFILGGCTNSGNTEKTAEDFPTVKVGYLPITHHLPLMIADARGQFTKINVEPIKFTNWPELAEALSAGKIDAAHMLNSLAIKVKEKGVPVSSLLMSVRDGSVIIVQNDIDDVQELKGKTIAIPSKFSPHYILLHKYLMDNGLEPGVDVLTPEMAPPDMVSALAAGSIDGYIVAEPFGAQAVDQGIGKALIYTSELGPGDNECVVVYRDDYSEENREAVQDYITQMILAGQFINEYPEEAAELAEPYLRQKKEVILISILDGRSGYDVLYPDAEDYQAFQDYMLNIGLLEKGIDINGFVDDSFAKESYKELGLTLPE